MTHAPATVTRLQPAHLTLVVDRCQDLRTERDALLAANEYQAQEIERLLLELDALRAHQPRPGIIKRFIAWIR